MTTTTAMKCLRMGSAYLIAIQIGFTTLTLTVTCVYWGTCNVSVSFLWKSTQYEYPIAHDKVNKKEKLAPNVTENTGRIHK